MDRSEHVVLGRRTEGSLREHVEACCTLIEEEQEKPLPCNAIIKTLCESVRLAREYCDYVNTESFSDNE